MDRLLGVTAVMLLVALWRWSVWRDRCKQWTQVHREDRKELEKLSRRLTQVESERDEARKEAVNRCKN